MAIQLTPVTVVSVRNTLTVSPVSVAPLKVKVEYVVVLSAFAAEFADTTTEKSLRPAVALEERTDRPVTATPVVVLATGVTFTSPLAIFPAVIKPVAERSPVTAAPANAEISPVVVSADEICT